MPLLSEFSSAAETGQGKQSSVLGPEQLARREPWSFAQVEPPVSGQQGGIRSIELQAFPIKQEHRDLRPVLRRVPDLANHKFVLGHRHLGFCPGRASVFVQVVLINGRRDVE